MTVAPADATDVATAAIPARHSWGGADMAPSGHVAPPSLPPNVSRGPGGGPADPGVHRASPPPARRAVGPGRALPASPAMAAAIMAAP